MEEMFEQLVTAETEEQTLEAEKFFLDKAKEAADPDSQQDATELTPKFDEFRNLVVHEYSLPFYAGFFATLSEMVKRHRFE